jgi:hypothetical protein
MTKLPFLLIITIIELHVPAPFEATRKPCGELIHTMTVLLSLLGPVAPVPEWIDCSKS